MEREYYTLAEVIPSVELELKTQRSCFPLSQSELLKAAEILVQNKKTTIGYSSTSHQSIVNEIVKEIIKKRTIEDLLSKFPISTGSETIVELRAQIYQLQKENDRLKRILKTSVGSLSSLLIEKEEGTQ